MHTTDIIIIGAGPVGLFTIAQLGMQARFSSHVIDSLDKPGGQPAELYPDKPIYDIPGFPIITGHALTENLLEQSKPFHPVLHLGEVVESLVKTDDNKWIVTTNAGTKVEGRAIIIASGRGLFDPRKPKIEGIDKCEGKSIFYAIRTGVREKLAGKRLLIAGGGDSALDWTMALSSEAKSVTLIHRRDSFRAAHDSVEKVKELAQKRAINFLVAEAAGLEHKDGALQSVRIKTQDGRQFNVETDYFLPFFGMTPKLGALSEWGLELSHNKIVVERKHSSTCIPGIFAIGDACTYEGKQELILTGFQEAAHAVAGAYKHVHGKDLRVQFTTSSTEILNALGAEKFVETMEQVGFATPIDDLVSAKLLAPVAAA